MSKDDYALRIIDEGRRRFITPRGQVIALATALVESDLIMYANENDPETLQYPHEALSYDYESSGLFQQRPQWWGTAADRMDPARSAGMFYEALARLDYNGHNSPGWYAQQVQQSAYPSRYDERMPEAQQIYDRLTAGPDNPGSTPVGEKVLDYDRSIVPQETYYWCGPASTQVVLNNRGVFLNEQDLADQIGTTVNGTDHIGLIAPVLNQYTGGDYTAVSMPNDPPTRVEKESFWRNLVDSIDAGYGVIANIVAPPSNYPQGVKGSQSPAYGGGDVYHYIALMGYDDNPGARAVWVADSGFRPYGYWISFDQLATLIPPKGYAYSTKETDMNDELRNRLDRLERVVIALLDQIGGAGVGGAVADGNPARFDGFEQGGNRSAYDLLSAIGEKNGIPGTRDLKRGK
ncbi:C39 family peptidase [Nocardia sp. NPDC059246]|uniref:C39 family peptidase n=1 Tax=unclassified Nocardia TaxID=2637762 RepID=UPI0036BDF9AE